MRKRALVPVPSFQTWDELNAYLLCWCQKEKEKHLDKWLEEQKALHPLPITSFSAARPQPVKVNSYALVTVDRNKYSVPSRYTGQLLIAKAYVDRVDIIHLSQIAATHPRCYARGEVILEILHYLPVLEHKPHAVTHAKVVRQLPAVFGRLRERMVGAHSRGYKDFLEVLLLLREYSVAELATALEILGESMITVATIRQTLSQDNVQPLPYAEAVTTINDAMKYDQLLAEVI